MAVDVAAVKEKVQRYLIDLFGGAQVDRDGDFTIRHGSTRAWVSVAAFGEHGTIVRVFAITNGDLSPSPELFHYVATKGSYPFGHLRAEERDGKVTLQFSHSLLGEYLDPDELKVALFFIAGVGDELDDKIKAQFGGRLFHEASSDAPAS